ncbi:MAG: TonB family protein [Alphaproteobacteria bacterium]|jgi:TonB family protein
MHFFLSSLCALVMFTLCRTSFGQAVDSPPNSVPILIQTSCTAAQDTWLAMNPDEDGHVTLRLVVRADGSVESAEIQSESTGIRLARIARRNYLKCRFRPATREGQPVTNQVSMRLVFGNE